MKRLAAGTAAAILTVTGCSTGTSRSEQLVKQLEAANVCTTRRAQDRKAPAVAGAPILGAWLCTVNPRHDLTVWASPSKRRTHEVIAEIRRRLPKGCFPLPDGVSRSEVTTHVKMIVGPNLIASTDVPKALVRAHVVLGGRIVELGTLTMCS